MILNIYCEYFDGRVIALSMSPVDDIFLSGSLDNTIRLWDLKSANCAVSLSFDFHVISIFVTDFIGTYASRKSTSS